MSSRLAPPVLDILYVDDHILVINKPAGLSLLAEGWDRQAPYLLKMLEEQFGKLWVVHRLDKFTSGVMVLAREAGTHRALSTHFEKRRVEKVYHAIAVGVPAWDERTVRLPLRANVGHAHRTVVDARNGKPSETRFRVLKRYPAHVLIEARPISGRTHQVRAHASAVGHPLLGDVRYGAPQTNLLARPALHAHSLRLPRFVQGGPDAQMFTAPYPEDFEGALRRLT